MLKSETGWKLDFVQQLANCEWKRKVFEKNLQALQEHMSGKKAKIKLTIDIENTIVV